MPSGVEYFLRGKFVPGKFLRWKRGYSVLYQITDSVCIVGAGQVGGVRRRRWSVEGEREGGIKQIPAPTAGWGVPRSLLESLNVVCRIAYPL